MKYTPRPPLTTSVCYNSVPVPFLRQVSPGPVQRRKTSVTRDEDGDHEMAFFLTLWHATMAAAAFIRFPIFIFGKGSVAFERAANYSSKTCTFPGMGGGFTEFLVRLKISFCNLYSKNVKIVTYTVKVA